MTDEQQKRGRGQPPKPEGQRKKARRAWISDDDMNLVRGRFGGMARFIRWALDLLKKD